MEPKHDVTDASWEGAVGEEAKPGDLPVAKPFAYGRWAGFGVHKNKYGDKALLYQSESPAGPGAFLLRRSERNILA